MTLPRHRAGESILDHAELPKRTIKHQVGQLLANFQKRNSLNWISYMILVSLMQLPGKIVEHALGAVANMGVLREGSQPGASASRLPPLRDLRLACCLPPGYPPSPSPWGSHKLKLFSSYSNTGVSPCPQLARAID